jgi:hypothetical protein
MDELSTLLREASEDAPPTGIDLDRLIAGERRRRRSWWGAASAAGAVLAVVFAAFVVRGAAPNGLVSAPPVGSPSSIGSPSSAGSGPLASASAGSGPLASASAGSGPLASASGGSMPLASPSGASASLSSPPGAVPCAHPGLPSSVRPRQTDPIRPLTESRDAALARLNRALPALLPAGARSSSTCGRIEIYWSPQLSDYQFGAQLPGDVSLAVMIQPLDRGTTPACVAVPDHCARTDGPDGSITMSDLSPLLGSQVQRSVSVYRTDDTKVLIAVIGREPALPSVETLSALGRAPALTLYP